MDRKVLAVFLLVVLVLLTASWECLRHFSIVLGRIFCGWRWLKTSSSSLSYADLFWLLSCGCRPKLNMSSSSRVTAVPHLMSSTALASYPNLNKSSSGLASGQLLVQTGGPSYTILTCSSTGAPWKVNL